MKFKFAASLISGLTLFASVSASPGDKVELDDFFSFKQLMMYFNEPLLQGAKAKGFLFSDDSRDQSFEGAESLKMAKTVLGAIKAGTWDKTDINDYAKYLGAGIDIMENMPDFKALKDGWEAADKTAIPPNPPHWQRFIESAKTFQNELKIKFDTSKQLILPFGWTGKSPHAINLIMERKKDASGKNLYKFVVVNTGDGLNHHYAAPDPNNVYPWLNRLWIEFDNIPEEKIFDNDDAWFVQMMIRLQFDDSVKDIESAAKTAPNYFYFSILSNFKDYLFVPDAKTDKLMPSQRSGSCTLSSLMASYLYYSSDKTSYNFNRVNLGHKLLKDFLDTRVEVVDFKRVAKDSFKTLITDGFDLVPRKLFYLTSSALAQQVLAYLEAKFPDLFKNSVFIGEGRSAWIKGDKKAKAIKALKDDGDVLKIVQNTVDICIDILEIIENTAINAETNRIKIVDSLMKLPKNDYSEKPQGIGIIGAVDGDFYKLLQIEIPRPLTTYSNLASLKTRLIYCRDQDGIVSHNCALDAFRMADKKWWTLLDKDDNYKEALELLDIFGTLTKMLLSALKPFPSFDDIVLLAHLQIGSWKTAVLYDEKLSQVDLGLRNFAPPIIIHKVLSTQLNNNLAPVTSGAYENWIVKTTYSSSSLSELSFLLDEYVKLGAKGERFLGPAEFIQNSGAVIWKAEDSLKIIGLNPMSKAMYAKMMTTPAVQKVINDIKKDKGLTKSAKWTSASYADYQIFMTSIQDHIDVNKLFPHFYKLWAQMIWSYHSLGLRPVDGKTAFKPSHKQDKPEELSFDTIQNHGTFEFPGQDRFDYRTIIECFKLKSNADPNIFFKLRHSQAFSLPANIINFESWLNYVKGAADPSIFDHIYFSYMTEFILNVPRIDLTSSYKIDQSFKATYPAGFTKLHIQDIFDSFMRLINQDLNYIISKQGRLELAEKTKLIKRPVNIAIPLVKFIGRVDKDGVISGHTVGIMLSKIYTAFFKFSPILSNLGLEDTDISIVNLILAQITDLPIRNPKTFIENLKHLDFPSDIQIFRKSLSRVHWFITKMFYIFKKTEFSHANDLYTYGFVYHPVTQSEEPIMNYILKKLVLVKHDRAISNWGTIKYFENGDIFRASSSTGLLVAAQLSSGKVVKNGNLIVEMGQILNDANFNNFFAQEDMNEAVKGEITKIGSTVLYTLNDFKFKGNLIVFLCPSGYVCQAYRKYDNKWYIWKSKTDDFKRSTAYKWIHGHKLFLHVPSTNNNIRDIIIIADDKEKPLLRLVLDGFKNKIHIDGLTDEKNSSWYLLKIDKKEDFDPLDKHLKTFTDTGTILALEEKKDHHLTVESLVVIYPGLRLKEDPNRPLSLVQKELKPGSGFEVKNSPGLVVVENQAIKDTGIKGTLIARNHDGQYFILAPIHDRKYNKEPTKPLLVEMIPLVGSSPAPQTRFQRLLLAFYTIRAREYGVARGLLQPFVSINQNEVFGISELEVLTWIIKINGGGPEADALKLIAHTHMRINKIKFPLEYIVEKDDKSEEGVLKQTRSKLHGDVNGPIAEILRNYLLSIRELPEKLYIYRIFPELLSSGTLKTMVDSLRPGSENVSTSKTAEEPKIACECENAVMINVMNDKQITEKTIYNLFSIIHNENPPGPELKRYLSAKPKLMHKVNNGKSTGSGNEMLVYCISMEQKDSGLWKKWETLAEDYVNYCNSPGKTDEETTALKAKLKEALESCMKKYETPFVHFKIGGTMKKTSSDDIVKSFASDAKNYLDGTQFNVKQLELVKKEDDDFFTKKLNEMKALIKVDTAAKAIKFQFAGLSKVLRKLSKSIEEFISSKGKITESEIKLGTATITSLREFNLYLEGKIHETDTKIGAMTGILTAATYDPANKDQPASLIEKLKRYFHQRKEKKFEHLYSCYQKLSISCVQAKFPQLDIDRCEKLLQETFEFYSHKILLEFLKTLSDNLEKFFIASKMGQAVSVDDISLFLDEAIKISDFNKRLMKPVILNFEYRSKRYRLRAEQVNDIEMLTKFNESTKSYTSAVIQRMMAAGKTLVLGTISVVQKALKSDQLSILVPPSSLYQSNLSSMQDRTYSYFKTKGQNFIFPRLQFSSVGELSTTINPFLKDIRENLIVSMKAKEYYVLSPDSLQAFLNAYIEMLNYATYKSEKEVKDALGLYSDIYSLFKTSGSIILDEIDMTMDPKKELNFPTMENEPFNLNAATLMTDLIEFSVFDETVRKIGLDIYGNNQSSLTSENYKLYMDRLIEYIETQLKDPKSLWSERLLDKDVSEILTPAKIIAFLKEPDIAYMRDWIKELYKEEKKSLADTLIIIKVQLYMNLKASLNASANLNYGAAGSNRAHILYAIPFLAANTPSPSSEFADRWETLNKTLLMFASVSCNKIIAKNMIGYLRKSAIRETSLSVAIEDTQTYKTAQILIPKLKIMNLNDQDDSHVEMIHKALITRSPTAIRLLFSYAVDEIFSEMKFPIEQITSNALNMASMFNSIQGYSGTIDNVNILPREVVAGAYINHMENEKNNGGISYKLVNDSEGKDVQQLTDEDLKMTIGDIIKKMVENLEAKQRDDLSAIIDAGAFFKNFKNRQVAEAIYKNFGGKFKAVLYYDEESNQVEYIKSNDGKIFTVGYLSSTDPDFIQKTTQVGLNSRFTYYDQRHITGSDILQPKKARALMTIGTRVLLRDILQGTLRMRQFMTSQKVHLVTSTAAANFYFSKCNDDGKKKQGKMFVEDLLTLGAFNEDDKQQLENEKLAYVKIDSEVRRFVLDEITRAIQKYKDEKDAAKAMALIKNLISAWFSKPLSQGRSVRDLFIRYIKENPIDWMITPVRKNPEVVLKNYTSYWLRILSEIAEKVRGIEVKFDFEDSSTDSGKAYANLKQVFATLTAPFEKAKKNMDSLMAFLSSSIVERSVLSDGGCEVQMQVFTQNLVEFDLEKMSKTYGSNPKPVVRNPFDISPLIKFASEAHKVPKPNPKSSGVVNLNEILFDPEFTDIYKSMARASIISKGRRVFVSTDLIQLIDVPPHRPYKIFSQYTWEASHILVQILPRLQGIRVTLLSTEAANEVRTKMANSFCVEGSVFWLCDLSGTITISGDPDVKIGDSIFNVVQASKTLFFDALVFNGSFDHILSNPVMKEIYRKKWLSSENFQLRAKFMLLRMYNLADKAKKIFGTNNSDLEILNRAAQGDKDALNSMKSSSSAFKKAQIPEKVETDFFASMPILTRQTASDSDSGGSASINVSAIFTEITNEACPSQEALSNASDHMKFDLSDTVVLQPESNKDSSTTDDFAKEPTPKKKFTKYLAVKGDLLDLNNDLDDEEKEVKDYSFFIVIGFGLAAFSSVAVYYYIRARKPSIQISPEPTINLSKIIADDEKIEIVANDEEKAEEIASTSDL